MSRVVVDAGEGSLFVHAEGTLGLVEHGVLAWVGLVAVLLAACLVLEGLAGGLLAVWDGLTVKSVSDAKWLKWWVSDAYRPTLSPALVTPSFTLSVVDLELSGVILSPTSGVMVSNEVKGGEDWK